MNKKVALLSCKAFVFLSYRSNSTVSYTQKRVIFSDFNFALNKVVLEPSSTFPLESGPTKQ